MSNNQPAAKDNDGDGFWLVLILIVLTSIIVNMFWEYFSYPIMRLRYYEAIFPLVPHSLSIPVLEWIGSTTPTDVTSKDISGSGELLSKFWRWPVLALVIFLGWRLYNYKTDMAIRYGKIYNKTTFAKQESEEWPVIKPLIRKNYFDIPLDDPIEGMRTVPRKWCINKQLLFPFDEKYATGDYGAYVVIADDEVLLIDRVKQSLAGQLGRKWTGYENLLRHEKSLFIAFLSHLADIKNNNDEKLMMHIINELAEQFCKAESTQDMKLIYSPTAEQWAPFLLDTTNEIPCPAPGAWNLEELSKAKTILNMVIAGHAYVRTVLMTLIQLARKNGKLPHNWFRWLKSTDRITWYCICDLGLEEDDMPSSIDAAGVRSHWLWERRTKTALIEPMINQVIPGLIRELEARLPESNDVEDMLKL